MISKDEVQKIAKLARLELTEEEIKKMQKDMSAILDYFEILKEAPLKKTTLMHQRVGVESNVVRIDEVEGRADGLVEKLIEQAPERKDNYIKVKSIL